LVYKDDVLQHFIETLPSAEVLLWLRDNGFVLIAGPPLPMSLMEICELEYRLFYRKHGGVINYCYNEKFFLEDKIHTDWLMLKKTAIENSFGRMWDKQLELISEVEYVPNAPEACWGITTYKKICNTLLFPDIFVKTSSVSSRGSHVDVGDLEDEGIRVVHSAGSGISNDIGLVSARKRTY
jgi:hypothetical protein